MSYLVRCRLSGSTSRWTFQTFAHRSYSKSVNLNISSHQTAGRLNATFFTRNRELKRTPTFFLSSRFGHLAGQKGQQPKDELAKATGKTAKDLGNETDLSVSEQRKKDIAIVRRLMVNIWPPGDWNTKGRVILGFFFLVGGKVCSVTRNLFELLIFLQLLNVQVPLLFKEVIDALNVDIQTASTAWVVAGSLILGCMCRAQVRESNHHNAFYRRSCENRSKSLQRTPQRRFRRRWATSGPQGSERDIWASSRFRSQVPLVAANGWIDESDR